MGQLPSIINIMNKTLLGILCLHICLLIGLSQSRQARMDSEWKSKRSIGARDGGQQKFPSPEVDPCPSGRDGGQQKFPSSEEKRSELNPYNRMGNLQKRLNPNHRMAPNFDKKSDDDAIIIEEKRDNSNLFRPLPENPEEQYLLPEGIVEVKRLNPNNRMAPDFGKRSAQAEWQTNTNPLFRPLNENKEDGANDEPNIVSVKRTAQADWQDLPDVLRPLNENTEDGANEDAIVSVKRSAQADWQDLPDVFRPLPQTENTIVQVKRGENMNPFNRMAEVNPFNRMATPPSKRNNCASNSPSVEYD